MKTTLLSCLFLFMVYLLPAQSSDIQLVERQTLHYLRTGIFNIHLVQLVDQVSQDTVYGGFFKLTKSREDIPDPIEYTPEQWMESNLESPFNGYYNCFLNMEELDLLADFIQFTFDKEKQFKRTPSKAKAWAFNIPGKFRLAFEFEPYYANWWYVFSVYPGSSRCKFRQTDNTLKDLIRAINRMPD